MKKTFIMLAAVGMLFVASGCTKQTASTEFNFKSQNVAGQVRGWGVYTNPAFRYEIRYPKAWATADSGEDGREAIFWDSSSNAGLKIASYANWQTHYTLEGFYKKNNNNLFGGEYVREIVKIGGQPGTWFKKVPGSIFGSSVATLDVVVLDLQDRIIEMQINGEYATIATMLNTMEFYQAGG
ncbi:MAG: hypothetical protein V1763_00760, partial [Parcubacteria group bacterium]